MRRSRAGAVHAARALVPAVVLVVVWLVAWPAVIDWGAGLRARHRWAISEAELDGQKRLLLWARQAPVTGGSPLAGAPNLILTPHIAGVTRESNERVSSMIAERMASALSR